MDGTLTQAHIDFVDMRKRTGERIEQPVHICLTVKPCMLIIINPTMCRSVTPIATQPLWAAAQSRTIKPVQQQESRVSVN